MATFRYPVSRTNASIIFFGPRRDGRDYRPFGTRAHSLNPLISTVGVFPLSDPLVM